MARTAAIGLQDFGDLIRKNYFYIDKTDFIREWWESGDSVTLITRPRCFGKTLNMSMTEQFFSVEYAGKGDVFEGLSIWADEKYRALQGTFPVISLSFARVKEGSYRDTREKICEILRNLYIKNSFLKESGVLTDADRAYYDRILLPQISNSDATSALYQMSDYLHRYYGKKVIILLDEYDTPMQEAYVDGFWKEMAAFTRSLFNSAFKTNPWLERAIMTGITRVSKESNFSDLNNLEVTTTSEKYAAAFGFTEKEVFSALEEFGRSEEKEQVKHWYDGFIFGERKDIYNPWSILNFLDKGKFSTYWANTSSNSLVSKVIREGSPEVKIVMEDLLAGKTYHTRIDEQIVFSQLDNRQDAIWSLLLASGYLKVVHYENDPGTGYEDYGLALTNMEVRLMFERMIEGWFTDYTPAYNQFIRALLAGDVKAMNAYMNRIALRTFSFFDTGNAPSESEPERFYHGFVLGLLVDLKDRYIVTSNRESGFGRYDVMLEPKSAEDRAYILEFKVYDPTEEKSLADTVKAAHKQIGEKRYAQQLLARGIPEENIGSYGFAFEGKTVLIG